jgi:hypothetical protein
MHKTRKEILAGVVLPCLIIFIGFVLRLYPLFVIPFQEDELYTYNFVTKSYSYIQHLVAPLDDRPPLFYIFIKLLSQFSLSREYLRLPEVLLSTFSLVFLYISFRRIDRLGAIILLFLSSFSLFQIHLSWQLRDYAVQIFVTSLLVYVLTRVIQKQIHQEKIVFKHIFILSILSLIGCLLNYIFIPFVIAIFGVCIFFVIVFPMRHKNMMVLSYAIPLISSVLLSGIYLIIQYNTIRITTEWITKPNFLSYFVLLGESVGYIRDWDALGMISLFFAQDYFYIGLGIVVFLVIQFYLVYVDYKYNKNARISNIYIPIFVLTAVLDVLGIEIGARILGRNLFLIRTFTPAICVFLIGFSLLISNLIHTTIKTKYTVVITVSCMILYLIAFSNMYSRLYKIGIFYHVDEDPTLVMIQKVMSLYQEGDQLFIIPIHLQNSYLNYYFRNSPEHQYSLLESTITNNIFQYEKIRLKLSIYDKKKIIFITNTEWMNKDATEEQKALNYKFWEYRDTAKKFCLTEPVEIMKNEIYSVSTCPLSL